MALWKIVKCSYGPFVFQRTANALRRGIIVHEETKIKDEIKNKTKDSVFYNMKVNNYIIFLSVDILCFRFFFVFR